MSSVLAKDRTISKFEYFMGAVSIRKSLVYFCLRNFGVKPKLRSPTYFFDNTWTEEDRNTINKLFHDHNYNNLEATYPYWLIEMYRNRLIEYANDMVENIIAAYSIFAFTIEEAYLKRNLQDLAIADCYKIKNLLQLMVETMQQLNKDTMLDLAGKIDKEIDQLKMWRKRDNKILARMQTKFPEYAMYHYTKMRDVTQMPTQSNPMIDKAKFEHALKAADIQREGELRQIIEIKNKNK